MKKPFVSLLSLLLALVMIASGAPTVSAASVETAEAPVTAAYPASATLVGDSATPPIDNQGSIGCCVSEAATYMQFTNAVARYMQSLGHTEWVPNNGSQYGNDAYIFSPKWTFNFSGSGTLWVYDILMTMGCATQNVSKFYKKSGSSTYYTTYSYRNGKWIYTYANATTSWDVTPGVMESALNYRLKALDRVEVRNVASGQITNSKAGKALLEKIKASINAGNVVLTGGMSGQWSYSSLTKGGSLGVAGDRCCYGALSSGGGGHQVSIVGYDDDIEFTVDGVTMKGGLLVANSWGQSWMNDGYVWFMYDGLNLVSEFAEQAPSLVKSYRTYAFDQYVFTDWRTDIAVGKPDLIVTAEVNTADREAVDLLLTRTDSKGVTETYQPKIFYYGDLGYHETYENEGYFNYAGVSNGNAVTASFAFSYEDLYNAIPAGKTVTDYVWGFILNVDPGHSATVGEVALKYKGDTVYSRSFAKTISAGQSRAKAYFSCSEECYVIVDSSTAYTVQPGGDSTNPVPGGGSYSFTVNPAKGYTDDFAVVSANGQQLVAKNGVYTVENITSGVLISVQNMIEDVHEQRINISMYNNDGWEAFSGEKVMVLSVSNAELSQSIYGDPSTLGTDSYPYWFRITDHETGLSYYTQPASAYYFDSATLYRLPIEEAGFSVQSGKQYDLTVDVVFAGRTLYTNRFSTVCTYSSNVVADSFYTVTYFIDGELYATDAYPTGRPVVKREAPDRHNYTYEWVGDSIPQNMGSRDLDVDAVYTFSYYEITWVVGKGNFTTRVAPGALPVFAGDLRKDSVSNKLKYEFVGWDKEPVPATEDTTYTAEYREVKSTFTVTWVVGTGKVEEVYEYGETPSFKGSTAKPSDAKYDYTFIGWDKSLRAVTKDATYTAKYEATEREGILGDLNGDGVVSIQDVSMLLIVLGEAGDSGYDLNGDGVVSIQDVSMLLVLLAK